MTSLQQHLEATTPKRILALDGGGIRGALTLGYLQQIEDILRKQHGDKPEFRLCDYFDLIGGTSTGSIIAACLAIGMKVEEITKMYMELGEKIFAKKYRWWNVFEVGDFIKGSYDYIPLENELKKVFGDITLESNKIRTGLCIVAKRADTNSVWPLINHPKGQYYNSAVGTNKDILLWKAVRASAAAPTYFIPQLIEVGGGLSTAAFVDGGVSMANNPSLQLLMVATLKGFPFHWKMGADNILLVSVGTGMSKWEKIPQKISKQHLLNWASQIPDMLMQDASWHNQTILQWMSSCNTRWCIDSEIGDLSNDLITADTGNIALLTYLRYNLWLDPPTLKQLMNKVYTTQQVNDLVEMSNAASRFELYKIGANAAANGAIDGDKKVVATKVTESHFPESFRLLQSRNIEFTSEGLMNEAEIENHQGRYENALDYINKAIDLENEKMKGNKEYRQNAAIYELKAKILKNLNLFVDAYSADEKAEQIRNENSFLDNKEKKIILDKLVLENVSIFDNCVWIFRPGINLLLGKNGYGKSHLLGLIIALLYNDKKKKQDWTSGSGSEVKATLCLSGDVPGKEFESELAQKMQLITEKQDVLDKEVIEFTSKNDRKVSDKELRSQFKNEMDEIGLINDQVMQLQKKLKEYKDTIIGDANTIRTKIGFVPVLAIPDSRFVDKSNSLIKASSIGGDLARNGAYEFLYAMPYADVIQNALFRTCLLYLESGKKFNIEPFGLIQRVIKELSSDKLVTKDGQLVYQDESKFEFKTIESDDKNGGFTIKVQPEDAQITLPIQRISQGTFSILAICCLIYNYLNSIYKDKKDILNQSAIVIIDELDAHIHPTWQRKLVGILRKNFPNIQFIISAHSPLLVSGCKANEIVVMRRNSNGKFEIENVNRSPLGLSIESIYSLIFEVEGKDVSLLRYKELYSYLDSFKSELDQLKRKSENNDLSSEEMNRMTELQDLVENVAIFKTEYEKMQIRKEENANEISNFIDEASKSLKEFNQNSSHGN